VSRALGASLLLAMGKVVLLILASNRLSALLKRRGDEFGFLFTVVLFEDLSDFY
jgi:hypothetical protein